MPIPIVAIATIRPPFFPPRGLKRIQSGTPTIAETKSVPM